MNQLKKELLFNIIVWSFLLSTIFSLLFTYIAYSNDESNFLASNWPEYSPLFIIWFLILYMFHALVSLLSFFTFRFIGKNKTSKHIVFYIIGIVIVGIICFLLKDFMFSVLFISFVAFSIVSMITNNHKSNIA